MFCWLESKFLCHFPDMKHKISSKSLQILIGDYTNMKEHKCSLRFESDPVEQNTTSQEKHNIFCRSQFDLGFGVCTLWILYDTLVKSEFQNHLLVEKKRHLWFAKHDILFVKCFVNQHACFGPSHCRQWLWTSNFYNDYGLPTCHF